MNSKKTIKHRKNNKPENNNNNKIVHVFIKKTLKNDDNKKKNKQQIQKGGIFDYSMIKKLLSYKNSLLVLSSVLLTADLYNKFNGNPSIISLTIKILNRLRKYFYDNPTSSFTIAFLYMFTYVDKDLFIKAIQISIDNFTNFIKNTTTNNINAVGFSLIIIIYSILNIKTVKEIYRTYLQRYNFVQYIVRSWHELIFSIKSKDLYYLNTSMSTIATIATIDAMLSVTDKIIGEILNNIDKKNNADNTLKFLENINTNKLGTNVLVESLYKNSCIMGTFLQKGTWNTIKASNDIINYPMFNLKLHHFDISFDKMFSKVSNPTLRVNIGLTPVMITIFMMINILTQDIRHELIDAYNQYISDFFVLVSKNKEKIKCLPSPSLLTDTIKNNKQCVIVFYENTGYENIYVINKLCKIIDDMDTSNYGWKINFVQINPYDNAYTYKKHGIDKTPFITLYNDGQIYKEFKHNDILIEQASNFNPKSNKKFDTLFIPELLKSTNTSIKKSEIKSNINNSDNLNVEYNTMDSIIKNLQFNIYSMFMGTIENSVIDVFNIINYSNATNFHKNKKELESYLQKNEIVLLYLYDNDSSCNIKKCNKKQEEQEMNFLLNYDKKSRDNIMFLKYNNLETINSLLEFYKLSALINLDNVKFACCHLDAYKDLDIHVYSYEKKVDTLSLFVKNKKYHDFTKYTPLTSHPNFELHLEKIVHEISSNKKRI